MKQEVIRLVDIKKHYKVGSEVVKALQSVSLTVAQRVRSSNGGIGQRQINTHEYLGLLRHTIRGAIFLRW